MASTSQNALQGNFDVDYVIRYRFAGTGIVYFQRPPPPKYPAELTNLCQIREKLVNGLRSSCVL